MKKNSWNLEDIFKTEQDFIQCMKNVEKYVLDFNNCKDSILENINVLLDLYENIQLDVSSLYTYSTMKYHLNLKDSKNISSYTETANFVSNITKQMAWFESSLIKLNKDELVLKINDIDKYGHFINRIYDSKEYILTQEEEKIIVSLNKTKSNLIDAYNALTISDRKSNCVEIDSEDIVVNSGNYAKYLMELDSQANRRKVFESFFGFYKDHSTTLAKLYESVVEIDVNIAKIRGFESALHAKLASNKIPTQVYYTLLKNVKKQVPFLKEYLEYRKTELGLETYHTYDRLTKINQVNEKYSYEKGYELVLNAAKSVNDEYFELVKTILSDGWIDVYPSENKITGAYSWGTYNAHPYILHNYNDTLNSVYTLMHEAGHSVHSLLSSKSQSGINASYPIYLAEIASTFAECILSDYLLETITDSTLKKTLIEENINNLIATYFRQTLFAEFELRAFELVESGKSLTSDVLCDLMNELYLEYYNINLDTEDLKKFVWAYIPHLIKTPFYVYQYSTCLVASFAIYNLYKVDNAKGYNTLIKILKSGGSEYPDKLLNELGINLSDDSTFEGITSYLQEKIRILKSL